MNFINLLTQSATSSSGAQAGGWQTMLVWLVPIGVIIVFMVISSRQRKKQQEEIQKKMDNIKPGDKVKTIGLIYGEVVEVDTEMETFVLKTGSFENPSYITVDKTAIYQVIPPLAPVEDHTPDQDVQNDFQPEEEVTTPETTEEVTSESEENNG